MKIGDSVKVKSSGEVGRVMDFDYLDRAETMVGRVLVYFADRVPNLQPPFDNQKSVYFDPVELGPA